MSKNNMKDINFLVKIMNDRKIIYRDTGKTISVPYIKGGNVEKPPKWFQYWSDNIFVPFVKEMKDFKEEVTTFMEEQKEFNKNIEHKVDAILECPTIKKEIKL